MLDSVPVGEYVATNSRSVQSNIFPISQTCRFDDAQSGRPRHDVPARERARLMTDSTLTGRQRQILEFIDRQSRDRGYPPSVREIGDAVGLTSPSSVHAHLNTLQRSAPPP
jgi:hypothetical protein